MVTKRPLNALKTRSRAGHWPRFAVKISTTANLSLCDHFKNLRSFQYPHPRGVSSSTGALYNSYRPDCSHTSRSFKPPNAADSNFPSQTLHSFFFSLRRSRVSSVDLRSWHWLMPPLKSFPNSSTQSLPLLSSLLIETICIWAFFSSPLWNNPTLSQCHLKLCKQDRYKIVPRSLNANNDGAPLSVALFTGWTQTQTCTLYVMINGPRLSLSSKKRRLKTQSQIGTFVNTLSCKSKGLTFFTMTILLWIFGRLFLLARGKKKKKTMNAFTGLFMRILWSVKKSTLKTLLKILISLLSFIPCDWRENAHTTGTVLRRGLRLAVHG